MKKRAMIITSLAAGLCVLVSSAFADTAIGSGYKSLKQAGKKTTAYLAHDAQSYSTETMIEFKLDDKTVSKEKAISMIDIKNQREYTENINLTDGEKKSSVYSDSKMSVYNDDDGTQRVMYYDNEIDDMSLAPIDPFEDKYAQDIENVIDAFVGSLQDTVQHESSEGKNVYTCSLEPSQVPAYINALVSLAAKATIDNMDVRFEEIAKAKITDGVHIKSADAKAIEDENGRITSIAAMGVVEGKDKDGNVHEFSCEFYCRFYDINTTVVKEAVIKDDAQITHIDNYTVDGNELGFDETSIGTYKRDILKKENGTVKKIGEKELTISNIDFENQIVFGNYTELYTEPGYEGENLNFVFEAHYNEESGQLEFEYSDGGESKTGWLSGNYDAESCYVQIGDEGSVLVRAIQ